MTPQDRNTDNAVLFRRAHAVSGASVRYYEPGKGLVPGQVHRTSYSRQTVWITGPDGETLQYSQRADNGYRLRGAPNASHPLEFIPDPDDPGAGEDTGPFTLADIRRSATLYDLVWRQLWEAVPNMVPEDYERLKAALREDLRPREEKYMPSLDGLLVRYPFAGAERTGQVERSTDSSVWVRFPELGSALRRFSRRTDGKYRLPGKGNNWPALVFLGEEQEQEPAAPAATPTAATVKKPGVDARDLSPAERDPKIAEMLAIRAANLAKKAAGAPRPVPDPVAAAPSATAPASAATPEDDLPGMELI